MQENLTHKVVSKQEWLNARLKLLEAEKELTRQTDELARKRMELPWVKIEKDYSFETELGKLSFPDMFQGRSQLMIYHMMFGPDYQAACTSCSAIADGFNGITTHLANHDVMFWAVSKAQLDKLNAYKQRMGWSFPWASTFGSDFNYDFGVSFTKEQQQQGLEFNYAKEPAFQSGSGPEIPARNTPDGPKTAAALAGTDVGTYARERMGVSSFILENDNLYHTYSSYSRGVDAIWSVYAWLDRAPKGRNESGYWWRRHDEYGQQTDQHNKSCCH